MSVGLRDGADERLVKAFMNNPGLDWSREGVNLFSDLDAIDEVSSLTEAGRGEVAILFVVQHQSLSHGLREL